MSDGPDNASIALLLADRVIRRVQTNPVSTLLGAAGVGLVLARGLPDAVLRMGAGLALRTAALHVLAQRDDAGAAPESDLVPEVVDSDGRSSAAE